jgi:outer membrane protein assembly factor BamA
MQNPGFLILRFRITGLLLILLILFLVSCNVTKNLPPGEALLVNNKIKVSNSKISSEDLSGYLKQTPNSKLFGLFRTNIALYNAGSKGKDSKFKKWLRNKVGSAPVLLDTSLNKVVKKSMLLYLSNKGYFASVINDSVVIKNRKAVVYYFVKTSTPYTIHNISYYISDNQLAECVYNDTSRCLIKKGQNYDSYKLSDERSRITNTLRNNGYFYFSSQYIRYSIDSSGDSRKMNIRIEIANPVVPSLEQFGTVVETQHKRYFIDKIIVDPEFGLLKADTMVYDTLVRSFKGAGKDTSSSNFYFLHSHSLRINPRTLAQSIFIKSNYLYNLSDVNKTYSRLNNLQVFKFINIQFHEASSSSFSSRDKLDCKIQLAQVPVQSFSVSPDVTNSAGALGVQGSFVYQNRNIFKGAQLLKLSLNGSAQMQGSIGSSNTVLFNTIEIGASASITFPQFLFPIKQEALSKAMKPKTVLTVGYNYQQRTDYYRHISNISFGYTWDQTEKIRHTLNPIEILFVKVFPDSTFTAYLNSLNDRRLKNQYTDHMIAGLKYTITYSGQDVSKVRDFFYVRANFETGGNLFYAVDKLFKQPVSSNGYYTIFKVQYAQYVRPDLDVRYFHMFSKISSVVFRFYSGIGIAYANSYSLPFEKAFFAGGANDIRGWKMGTLGPGKYHNDTLSSSFDQTGDMQIQLNMEYRFPVYKFLRSAVFVDMGNVWLIKPSSDFSGGEFAWKTFLPQVAVDVGLGIRADFDYFIFRLDPAVPIRVPYYPGNDHWYFSKLRLSDIIWNFGIGYPF